MSSDRPSDVLGSLPRTRPHRRSDKRGPAKAASPPSPDTTTADQTAPATTPRSARAKPGATAAAPKRPATAAKHRAKAAQPRAATAKPRDTTARPRAATAKPRATPAKPPVRRTAPPPTPAPPLLGTAVQAAAELAEIGLTASARAVREMLSRLPRP